MRLRTAYTMLAVKTKLEASEWPFEFALTDHDHPQAVGEEDTLSAVAEILDPHDEDRALRTYYLSLSSGVDDFHLYVEFDQDITHLFDRQWSVYEPERDSERLDDTFSEDEVDQIVGAILDALTENERKNS